MTMHRLRRLVPSTVMLIGIGILIAACDAQDISAPAQEGPSPAATSPLFIKFNHTYVVPIDANSYINYSYINPRGRYVENFPLWSLTWNCIAGPDTVYTPAMDRLGVATSFVGVNPWMHIEESLVGDFDNFFPPQAITVSPGVVESVSVSSIQEWGIVDLYAYHVVNGILANSLEGAPYEFVEFMGWSTPTRTPC